jgi:hypothetical protein
MSKILLYKTRERKSNIYGKIYNRDINITEKEKREKRIIDKFKCYLKIIVNLQ